MKTRKYAYASSLVSPYKFVNHGALASRHYDKFHSESFSFNLRSSKSELGWLMAEECGIVNKEEMANDWGYCFSESRVINREY